MDFDVREHRLTFNFFKKNYFYLVRVDKVVLILGSSSRIPIHNITKIITSNANDTTITINREIKTRGGSFLRNLRNKSLNIFFFAFNKVKFYFNSLINV